MSGYLTGLNGAEHRICILAVAALIKQIERDEEIRQVLSSIDPIMLIAAESTLLKLTLPDSEDRTLVEDMLGRKLDTRLKRQQTISEQERFEAAQTILRGQT